MERYKITDMQTNEVVGEYMSLDDLVSFVYELFWDDEDLDLTNSEYDKLQEICLCCDYYVEEIIK